MTVKTNMKLAKHEWKGKAHLTWKDIGSYVRILCDNVQQSGFQFDKIATVSRGGLVPARLVADHFNIKTILVDQKKIPKRTLFVDDIYDSGDTFKKIFLRVCDPDDFIYTTLIARRGVSYPDELIYAKKTRGKEYVIFPWDKLEFDNLQISIQK